MNDSKWGWGNVVQIPRGPGQLGSPGRLGPGLDGWVRTLAWGFLRTRDRAAGVGGDEKSAFSTSTQETGMLLCAWLALGPSRIWRFPHLQGSSDRTLAHEPPERDPTLCADCQISAKRIHSF